LREIADPFFSFVSHLLAIINILRHLCQTRKNKPCLV